MKVNKELLKGSIDIAVLAAVRSEPLYGYEIAKRVQERSNDLLSMGEGTLYTVLHKLEKSGLLESYWEESTGRRRKYYSLTKKGREALAEKKAEWQAFASAMHNII
jgi:PadR family transcriptional regulator PadR